MSAFMTGIILGQSTALAMPMASMPLAAADAAGTARSLFSSISTWVAIAGAAWAVWGAIGVGTAMHDHNGPGIQGGLWKLVGGAIIGVAGAMFGRLV